MIIDLSEWNEYIANDVPPGPIPRGVRLETMHITTAKCYTDPPLDDFPPGLRAEVESIKTRLFWRLSDDR